MAFLRRWLRRVLGWRAICAFVQREIQLFLYFLLLFTLFRIGFIAWMRDYMGSGVTARDILTALHYGGKLSLKSAGLLTAGSALAGLVFGAALPGRGDLVRRVVGGVYIALLTTLFCARIPYYAQFHSGFNQLIFNALYDDVYALGVSLIAQYQLPLRLLFAAALSWLLYKAFVRWMRLPLVAPPEFRRAALNWSLWIFCACLLYQGAVFVSNGGSMRYAGDVDWENSGVTKDQLLNEAILDDMQALYRAHVLNGRLESSTGLSFTPRDVSESAAFLTGIAGDDLDACLKKTALGVPEGKPKHVFMIVSESYANWPLLKKYESLHLADGVKALIARPDSAYAAAFLPNGMSTISAVMGIVTGLADANLYLTTMPEAYRAPYATAVAPQMRKLGYRTRFWYAGPASWERVRDFTLAQGFQEFYGSGDYTGASGNVWGCDDADLYRAVLAGADPDQDSFNVILNVSNHSPFTVDLDEAGFDRAALAAALPEAAKQDDQLVTELGHFWYADQMIARFVKAAREKYPDSLFMVLGDHGDRVNIDKTPSLYERYGIPFIVSGKGVSKRTLPESAAGSQIDVAPTLIELVAPRGFEYCAVGRSLTRGSAVGVNYGFWITRDFIGRTDAAFEPEAIREGGSLPDQAALRRYIDAVRSVSWWRGKHGSALGDSGADDAGGAR